MWGFGLTYLVNYKPIDMKTKLLTKANFTLSLNDLLSNIGGEEMREQMRCNKDCSKYIFILKENQYKMLSLRRPKVKQQLLKLFINEDQYKIPLLSLTQDNLRSCCTAESSIELRCKYPLHFHHHSLVFLLCFFQESSSSMLENSFYVDDQHGIADSTTTPVLMFPATPMTHRPYLSKFDGVNPALSSSMTDTCSPFSPVCSPTGSDWDALRSRSKIPGCCDRDSVSAAAHLHLLGESLSLIGQHLQETDVSRFTEDKTHSL